MAKSKIMIDNARVKVTEWAFDPGDETGQHTTNMTILLFQ